MNKNLNGGIFMYKNRNGVEAIDIDQYTDEYLNLTCEEAVSKKATLSSELRALSNTLDIIIDIVQDRSGKYKVVNRTTFIRKHNTY